jgi:hypothetical protein
MKLDWMLLANYAEDNKGLLNVSGASWDTVEVRGALQVAPQYSGSMQGPIPVAIFQGFLVVRLQLHPSETGREYGLTVLLADADGKDIARLEARSRIDKVEGLPTGWLQGANVILPLTGVPLPAFGHYSIVLRVDNQHLGDISFRVIKKY